MALCGLATGLGIISCAAMSSDDRSESRARRGTDRTPCDPQPALEAPASIAAASAGASGVRALLAGLAGLLLLGGAHDGCADEVTLLDTGADWRLRPGETEASSPDPGAWRVPGFDDSGWAVARLPVFYGAALVGTELSEMRGRYTCVFLRREVVIERAEEVAGLELGVVCDGGFVAWLNGQEVARDNVPDGSLTCLEAAKGEPIDPVGFVTYPLTIGEGGVVSGTNVLAVQAFTTATPADADFVFDGRLTATRDAAAPVVTAVLPPPDRRVRELGYIEVQFDEPVWGVEATDLLVNDLSATNVVELAPDDYLFTFEPPVDGPVTVVWRGDHGITDRVPARHSFAGGSWGYWLDSAALASDVTLSEFMADNKRTLNDNDGDSSDWIEIANAGDTAAHLAGWFLTDDAGDLTRWRFPDVDVPAKGFLVVFASGKNRTNATAKLHANFKLASGGGYLALVDPATNIVSDFAPVYPPQSTDVSYGRAAGDVHAVGYFSKPTPGKANSTSGPGFAPEIEFSAPSRPFTNAFELRLSTGLSQAEIRYTLNGSLPTNTSLLYTAPLTISNSIQVRARAFATGLLPGPLRSEYFVLLHSNVFGFASDLPVMMLHSLGRGAPTSSKLTFAQMSLFEPSKGRTTLLDRPAATLRAGLQIRGSSTEGLAKSSYKVELWDEYERDADESLLGLPADSDWVLYAPNTFEPVLIHNPFVHQLSRDVGQYSPRTRFVEVYFNRGNGPLASSHYMGIYVLEEKIKIGEQRLNIDELEPEHLAPPEVTGGYLLKFDRLDPGDGGLSAGGATMAYVDPKEREIELSQRRPQLTYLRDYFNAFSKALNGTNWLHPTLGYAPYIDVPGWIDYHVLEVLSGNVDALVLSAYFHKPRNGPIVFGPHWDFDRALGSTDGRDSNPRNWTTGPFFSAVWWNRLFNDKDFWQRWVDRWQELRESHLALTNIHGLVDRLANEVRQAQPREYQKWRITLRGGSYQSEVNLMKNWLSNRIDFIDRQMTQPPRLSHPGGAISPGLLLTLTRPTNATLYYTLDGTDPRAAKGGVAPGARVYSQAIRIDANARVVARAWDSTKRQTGGPPSASSTPWSRPVAATFVVTLPALRFGEIMFHPADPPAGSTNSAGDFEFVELVNIGATALNLPGFRLTNGIDFVFASTSAVTRLDPGRRVLVVRNRAAFLQRYPNIGPIAGEFTRNLGDHADRLTLFGPLNEIVCDFVFQADWQALADGLGFSIVPVDERADPAALGSAASWRLSAASGGSPGAPDIELPRVPAVWVNEVLAHPGPEQADAVELFNPNRTPVDISGWYLSDNFKEPAKYRFPAGTVLDPRSFLVVTGDEFGGAAVDAFGLDADGDEIHLFSAGPDATLTGYHHGFAFAGSAPGSTFGVHQTGAGTLVFARQRLATLGGPNLGAAVGPLVVSELMYQPPEDQGDEALGEYIELQNISHEPLPLFDPLHPEFTWRLRGAIRFDFPPGIVLPPAGHVVVVGFNPAQDLSALAALRERYVSVREALIAGPWEGRLANEGDTLRVIRPGEARVSNDGQIVPREVWVEEVPYRPEAPWSTAAAGRGAALGRYPGGTLAMDPASWFTATPSPGVADRDGDGLPDDWEAAYGLDANSAAGTSGKLGDPDRDSIRNRDEYAAGTAPWIGPVQLEAAVVPEDPASLELIFVRLAGHTHTLLRRESRAGAAWEVIEQYPAGAIDQPTAVVVPLDAAGRWFRVRVD